MSRKFHSQASRKKRDRSRVEGKCTELSVSRLFLINHGSTQLPDKVIALSKQIVHTTLAFGNIGTHIELSVHSHVVNGVELRWLAVYW